MGYQAQENIVMTTVPIARVVGKKSVEIFGDTGPNAHLINGIYHPCLDESLAVGEEVRFEGHRAPDVSSCSSLRPLA